MSHFAVAVFHHEYDDLGDILAPFEECPSNPAYLEFVPCSKTEEELIKKFEEVKEEYGYHTFEDFMEEWYGYRYNEATKQWGNDTNPNAKWDWWMTGGRFCSSLRLKPQFAGEGSNGSPSWANAESFVPDDALCDSAPISKLDFSRDMKEYNKAIRFWEVVVEGQPLKEGEDKHDFWSFWKPEYYIDQFGTKEKYAEDCSDFSVWAFIDLDGCWHEKGSMGWWAMNDATQESRESFNDKLKEALVLQEEGGDEIWITIVDCHI